MGVKSEKEKWEKMKVKKKRLENFWEWKKARKIWEEEGQEEKIGTLLGVKKARKIWEEEDEKEYK